MKVKLLLAVCVASLLFTGCQKENELVPTSAGNKHILKSREEPNCASSYDLMAGQHYLAVSVQILSDDDSIYVGYMTDGWSITATHLYIGDCAGIPVNGSGSPVPGRFPISSSFNPGVSEVWYSFPLASLPNCGCIAAHAVVRNNTTGQTETGWSRGQRFTNNSWAMRSNYCLCGRIPIDDATTEQVHGRNHN
jgi:hypothetical protein